jgi:hypothetical protein
MKKPERDEDAFEESPRSRRPARPKDEETPPRRKAPPPVADAYIEEAQERPRRRPGHEDEDDEENRSRRPARRRHEDEAYSSLIPYRNVSALIAYYSGMGGLIAILGGIALILFNPINPQFVLFVSFGVIYGLGGLLALLGIIFGIIGVVYANKNPRSRGMGHAITGIVLGILEMLGLVAILALGFLMQRRI